MGSRNRLKNLLAETPGSFTRKKQRFVHNRNLTPLSQLILLVLVRYLEEHLHRHL